MRLGGVSASVDSALLAAGSFGCGLDVVAVGAEPLGVVDGVGSTLGDRDYVVEPEVSGVTALGAVLR